MRARLVLLLVAGAVPLGGSAGADYCVEATAETAAGPSAAAERCVDNPGGPERSGCDYVSWPRAGEVVVCSTTPA